MPASIRRRVSTDPNVRVAVIMFVLGMFVMWVFLTHGNAPVAGR